MKQLQWMKGGRWLVVGSRPSRAGGYPLSIKSVPATAQGQQSDSCEERAGSPGSQTHLAASALLLLPLQPLILQLSTVTVR